MHDKPYGTTYTQIYTDCDRQYAILCKVKPRKKSNEKHKSGSYYGGLGYKKCLPYAKISVLSLASNSTTNCELTRGEWQAMKIGKFCSLVVAEWTRLCAKVGSGESAVQSLKCNRALWTVI